MNKPKNIKEFQKLVKRYETITLKEIEEMDATINIKSDTSKNRWKYVAKNLTGFGSTISCILCKKGMGQNDDDWLMCKYCVYDDVGKYTVNCIEGSNRQTYMDISRSTSAQDLLNAYRNRAKHLRNNYSKYLIENGNYREETNKN